MTGGGYPGRPERSCRGRRIGLGRCVRHKARLEVEVEIPRQRARVLGPHDPAPVGFYQIPLATNRRGVTILICEDPAGWLPTRPPS
jgi:hypothetical protein